MFFVRGPIGYGRWTRGGGLIVETLDSNLQRHERGIIVSNVERRPRTAELQIQFELASMTERDAEALLARAFGRRLVDIHQQEANLLLAEDLYEIDLFVEIDVQG